MLVLEWKERAFVEIVNSRFFCWFPAAILVHHNGTPIWRLHTKLYKGAWKVSANNSETGGHKDLRLGQIVYIFSLLQHFIFLASSTARFLIHFLLRDSENDLLNILFLNIIPHKSKKSDGVIAVQSVKDCHSKLDFSRFLNFITKCHSFPERKNNVNRIQIVLQTELHS